MEARWARASAWRASAAILATLSHPNIARLYDAGVAGGGRPSLAIEYVEGRRSIMYLPRAAARPEGAAAAVRASRRCGRLRARASSSCTATSKPGQYPRSRADGQVRLLDFGIAKLLDDGQAKETRLTELAGRAADRHDLRVAGAGSPASPSPPTRRRVYSLGVILYRARASQAPVPTRPKRESRGALEDAILQEELSPPSDVADRRFYKSLRGDLDTTPSSEAAQEEARRPVLDGPRPRRRYRPLSHRATGPRAAGQCRWYRAPKVRREDKLAVGTAGAVLTAIVVGATVVAWQARVALAEKARAEEVKEFIASVFREADPTQGEGKVLTAAELLRQAERRLQD